LAALGAQEDQKPSESPRAEEPALIKPVSARSLSGLSRAISIVPDAAQMQRKTSLNRVDSAAPKATPVDAGAIASVASATESQLSKLPSLGAPTPAPTGGVREMAQVFEVAGISDQVRCALHHLIVLALTDVTIGHLGRRR
jgi:hypothetical protein